MTEINDVRQGWTSASNAAADMLCPGRHLAQKGLPDDHSPDAEHGRIIHKALFDSSETKNLTALSVEQRDIFDSCREIEKKIVQQYFGANHGPMRVWREQRYWARIPAVDGQLDNLFSHSGAADVVFVADQKALICDYKTLAGDVQESARNQQLRDLAVMIARHHLSNEAATAIIQPLVTHSPELCIYVKEDIDRAEKDMIQRVRFSNNPNSPRSAGEVQCKFCKAKHKCAEYNRFAGALVPKMLDVLEVPVADWTPEQRAVAAMRLPAAFKWLEGVEAHLKELLAKDADSVPGFALKPGNTRETIKDPQQVFERFAALGGELGQYMPCVTVGKTKLKEAVNAVTKEKGKALDATIKKLLDGLVESKQNAPSLVKKEEA